MDYIHNVMYYDYPTTNNTTRSVWRHINILYHSVCHTLFTLYPPPPYPVTNTPQNKVQDRFTIKHKHIQNYHELWRRTQHFLQSYFRNSADPHHNNSIYSLSICDQILFDCFRLASLNSMMLLVLIINSNVVLIIKYMQFQDKMRQSV